METCSITASPTLGASPALLTDDARAALLHAARGLPRLLSHLLRLALLLADERASPQIDASIINSALILLHLDHPKQPQTPPKSRFQRDPRSRA
ncbi:MAG: hypothetical protein IPK80_28320 [Nannocystis sp.]|nr:hypothetical protein [Nannocystis sp.]